MLENKNMVLAQLKVSLTLYPVGSEHWPWTVPGETYKNKASVRDITL